MEAYNTAEKIREDYEYYITNWELDNGLFKGIPGELILQKMSFVFITLRLRTAGEEIGYHPVGYSGFSGRVRITKGLSYRMGSYNVSSQKEMVDISKGKGSLTVTNKRIIFKNADGSFRLIQSR